LAGIPAFGYLLYFTGRAYSEAYHNTLGIDPDILNFGFWDYVYSGAKGVNVLVPIVFTVIFLLFLNRYLLEPSEGGLTKKYRMWEIGYPVVFSVWYSIGLAVLTLVAWFRPDLKVAPAFIFVSLATCIAFLVVIVILWDRAAVAWIKERKAFRWLFPIAIVLGLIFLPYTSADSWGRFNAAVVTDNRPFVELEAPYQLIDDIQWEPTNTNSFRTVNHLRLLFSNQQYLVVQSVTDGNSSYVVSIDDILSIKIVDSEK
jgi:hypothetical protein